MDDIVKAALAKWPNVPACYGWLALDQRGQWRMRDAACQAAHGPGDVIRHPALIDFIQRNYQCDQQGCWYFQNGPQKVYLNLSTAPYILRLHRQSDGEVQGKLHDDQALPTPRRVAMNNDGQLLVGWQEAFAALDDRDLLGLSELLYQQQQPASDEVLADWLNSAGQSTALELKLGQQHYPISYASSADWFNLYRFVALPHLP